MGSSFIVTIFGRWNQNSVSGESYLESGIGYYFSPPRTLRELFFDPIHTVFYISVVLYTFYFICRIWVEVNGSSARDVAKQLLDNDMMIEGMREGAAMTKHLARYINIASGFGGVVIGVLSICAHFSGALGSGTGIVLGVMIVYKYFEIFAQERQKMGGNLGLGF